MACGSGTTILVWTAEALSEEPLGADCCDRSGNCGVGPTSGAGNNDPSSLPGRRPRWLPEMPERGTTENVQVSVEDGLPGVGAGVEHQPVTRLGDALGGGHRGGAGDHLGQQTGVRGGQ